MQEEFSGALMHVDAAAEVLEKADEEELLKEQVDVRKRSTEMASFTEQYRAHRRSVAPAAAPPGKGGGKGRGGGGGGRGRGLGDAAHKLPATVEQSTAKRFLPEGASIWRGLTRGEWCGHFPPNPRIRERWADYPDGEIGSMKAVLRRLWLQFATYHGVDWPACCPFADRLASAAAPAVEA